MFYWFINLSNIAMKIQKRTLIAGVLIVVALAAVFVRTYKFQDWLYFKMDQSRDALLIANAVKNGPEYLPLLGARAGATTLAHGYLRLGPAFYYFQYLSGKIFNSTEPYVFAYPDLFFSLLVLPLMYFFLKEYFSKRNAILIVIMYAFSFIVIQYSRFSWNPNALPFFMILAFFALLKFLNADIEKAKIKWAVIYALGASITSQLHFFGFFSVLGVTGVLLLIHFQVWKKTVLDNLKKLEIWKKILKYAGVVCLIFLIAYTPVIISDYYKKGENIHNFFEAIGSKPSKQSLTEKIKKDISENLKYYCLDVTSFCYQGKIKENVPAIAITVVILLSGIALLIRGLMMEQPGKRRDFLFLVLVWAGVFTILTIPVAFQLRPRFFLVVFLIPFIFIGLIFQFLEEKFNKKSHWMIAIIFMSIILLNTNGTYAWFKEQAESQVKDAAVKRTLILKAKDGITLGQLQKATDYMYARRKPNANIYYYVKPEYVRPIKYLFYNLDDPKLKYGPLIVNGDPNAQYFAIVPSGDNPLTSVYKKYGNSFEPLQSMQFGQLTVYELNFTNRNVSNDFRFNKDRGKTDRIFWKDVFGIKEKNNTANIEGSE